MVCFFPHLSFGAQSHTRKGRWWHDQGYKPHPQLGQIWIWKGKGLESIFLQAIKKRYIQKTC